MNPILTEVTTGATDAVLGVIAIASPMMLAGARSAQPFKTHLWLAVFGLLVIASVLGAITHGLDLDEQLRNLLWQPLYLSLGLMLGLIAVAAVTDGWGVPAGRKMLPVAMGVGLLFYGVTVIADGIFLVFVVYEAVALLFALGVYLRLARAKIRGASMLASGIAITLVAAVLQQTDVSIAFIWPFDHNGVFHLVQMPGLLLMAVGVQRRLTAVD
jgi:hypothetical protein